ncbi:MAG: HNH endonuclease [Selenomonadaceae bacterium]|nr:HNH endonuclease [Selenomonadaceae bacterium]
MKNPERVAELLAALKNECEYRFEFDAVDALAQSVKELPRVAVIDDKHQEFLGKVYNKREPSGHFYRSYNKANAGLHRVVWSYYFGEIPDGCEIHHIDKNPANNNIENLQCLSKTEHRRLHKANQTSVVCEVCGKSFFTRKNFQGKCCSQKCYDKKRRTQPISCVCAICGKIFATNARNSAKTCSSECAHALAQKTRKEGTAKRHRGFREERTCIICGQKFTVRKDAKTKTCSLECSHILRQQTLQNHSNSDEK